MSRSNYSDECEGWGHICWRGAVTSVIRSQRGQALIRELIAGLDAMPTKELIAEELEVSGQFCALGVVGKARGIDLAAIDRLTAERARAVEYHSAELADVRAERDAFKANLQATMAYLPNLDALAKDAARYQWLKVNPTWLGWEHDFRPDEVEREIDAAMKEPQL